MSERPMRARDRVVKDVRAFLARPGGCWRCGGKRRVLDVDRPETCRVQACPVCAGGRAPAIESPMRRDTPERLRLGRWMGGRMDMGGFFATFDNRNPSDMPEHRRRRRRA